MRAVAVAATFGVVWAMTAPVQAANVKLMYVGQASGLNSPVRIKLNYKTYKKQAISVRLVTSTGSEVTVGTGFLNSKGVMDVCTTRPIAAGQLVKVFAGYKQVMAKWAAPAAGAAPADICGSAAPGGNGSNGSNGNDGATGARGPRGASNHIQTDLVTTGKPSDDASASITEECTAWEDEAQTICSEYTSYLSLTIPSGAPGQDGKNGVNGNDGAPGQNGVNGKDGAPGQAGKDGSNGSNGSNGTNGRDGMSAYQIALDNGYTGDVSSWLMSLRGAAGKSAYDVAVDEGYTGSRGDWVSSLRGKSAYELAAAVDPSVATMTMAQWVQSLHGKDGKTGFEMAGVGVSCPIGNSGQTGVYDVKQLKSTSIQGTSTDTDYVLVCKK